MYLKDSLRDLRYLRLLGPIRLLKIVAPWLRKFYAGPSEEKKV
jgi:hypothetical protein